MSAPKVQGSGNTDFKSSGGEAPKTLSKEDVAKLIEKLIEMLMKKMEDPEEAEKGGGDKAGEPKPEDMLAALQKLKGGEKMSTDEMKMLEKGTGIKAEDLEKIAGDGKDIK